MWGVKIDGVGKAVPTLHLTNDDIADFVETSDEWIQSRTGIQSRYISTGETTTQLAALAGDAALKEAHKRSEDIDLVIVATVTPDHTMPSTACKVAKLLNIKTATCFDMAAACSGFIYASEVAISLIRQGGYENALVIGAEVLSKTVDWKDRNTCILFADGAGAVVYSKAQDNKMISFHTASNGEGSDLITLPALYEDNRFQQAAFSGKHIEMNGKEVYKFAVTIVPQNIQEMLQKVQYQVKDIDWFVLHQANSRIIDSVAKKLGVEENKFFKNLQEYGNTSAASIPIALADAKAHFKKGDKIVIAGFGAGLTWGSMLMIWE